MEMDDDIFFIPEQEREQLIGKRILIIDDVCTSGRTIEVMIKQLQKIKCDAITIFVIARK